MSWYNEFGLLEIAFVALFAGFYGLYLYRVVRIARALHTPFSNLFIKLILRTLYFALFLIALLGPSFGGSSREIKSVGKDIFICVDLSRSMDAFDIQPTRLEKVKFEMKRIVDAFSSDRIGIIIFSSDAFMQCPLTFDQNALNLFIDAMNSRLVPSTGTDFGPPLKLAIRKLDEDAKSREAQNTSKIIVLISDGEDFGENTDEVIDEIEDRNIKVFTLGVGTEEGGNIYAGSGLKKDRQGNNVITRLNPAALKKLASKTDGQYYEISNSRNDVNRLINNISRIEGEVRDARTVDVTANKYFYFLAAGILLFLIDVLIHIRTFTI